MTKKKNVIAVIGIFILAFLAANFSYPLYFNRAADFLNGKLGEDRAFFPHFPEVPFRLGLDLRGGSHLLYEADLSGIEKKDYSVTMERLRDRIERRVNNRELAGVLGVQEVVIQTQETAGRHRLIVELPGIKDPAKAIQLIGETPFLEFKEMRPEEESNEILAKIEEVKDKTFEEIQEIDNWQLAFEDPYFTSTSLTGKFLEKAELGFEPNTQKPLISIQFDDEGAKLFEELTSVNVGKPLAIYIDNEIISTPVVQEVISGGKAQISGSFTIPEAKTLVSHLNEGALPVPISLVSQELVGPSLGRSSLEKVLKAGMIGFLVIFIFMIILYRLPGTIAVFALMVNAALLLALFKIVSVTLTLSGIAGFILSVGMAVDANILIFARIKEELSSGRDFSMALNEGFNRAWPSIWDSNVTTMITSLILFQFGTSFVKGFASTLIIGIITSMFSAIVITKLLLRLFEGTRLSRVKWLWR
ncbi:MAG: protein translocase subunit SecD [bacterium]